MSSEDTSRLQSEGRRLLTGLNAALRSLRLYPLENEIVQQALAQLHGEVLEILSEEGQLDLRVVGDFFFLNEVRLRLDLQSFSTFGSLAKILGEHGIGGIKVERGIAESEWVPFLSLLLREPAEEEQYEAFCRRLGQVTTEHVDVLPEEEESIAEEIDDEQAMAAAKQTYARSVAVARDMMGDVRLGMAVNVRKVKRSVQDIVDQVLSNAPSMITMTTLRHFDEYTFTHCVNVCIFSVVIGQRLGLTKAQLYELGMCGLLHDIGKMRMDPDVLNKPGKLDEDEWLMIQQHPTEGLLLLFDLGGFAHMPYRSMLAAYEHHMKPADGGYPSRKRRGGPGLFSRIVSVADGFDAATSIRSYQYEPNPPDKVLREMRDNPRRGFDPPLVKALINATGVYPIGTLVILDSLEMAVVSGVNPDPKKLHLPTVKIIADEMAVPYGDPPTVDLAETDPETGWPLKQIIKTVDPEQYDVRVSDYLI